MHVHCILKTVRSIVKCNWNDSLSKITSFDDGFLLLLNHFCLNVCPFFSWSITSFCCLIMTLCWLMLLLSKGSWTGCTEAHVYIPTKRWKWRQCLSRRGRPVCSRYVVCVTARFCVRKHVFHFREFKCCIQPNKRRVDETYKWAWLWSISKIWFKLPVFVHTCTV